MTLNNEVGKPRGKARTVGMIALVAIEAVVHLGACIVELHLPADPTAMAAARNIARNFVFDGTAAALAVLALCMPAALFLVRALEARVLVVSAAAAALAAGAWSFASAPTASAIAALQPPHAAPQPAARGYNVVLISIDSLRADHLGAYGYPKATSPTIDRSCRPWSTRARRPASTCPVRRSARSSGRSARRWCSSA